MSDQPRHHQVLDPLPQHRAYVTKTPRCTSDLYPGRQLPTAQPQGKEHVAREVAAAHGCGRITHAQAAVRRYSASEAAEAIGVTI